MSIPRPARLTARTQGVDSKLWCACAECRVSTAVSGTLRPTPDCSGKLDGPTKNSCNWDLRAGNSSGQRGQEGGASARPRHCIEEVTGEVLLGIWSKGWLMRLWGGLVSTAGQSVKLSHGATIKDDHEARVQIERAFATQRNQFQE